MTDDVKKALVEIGEINVQLVKLQWRIEKAGDAVFKIGIKRQYRIDKAIEKLEEALEGLSALYFELKDKE